MECPGCTDLERKCLSSKYRTYQNVRIWRRGGEVQSVCERKEELNIVLNGLVHVESMVKKIRRKDNKTW